MSEKKGKRPAIDGMNSDHAAKGEEESPQRKRLNFTITSDDDTKDPVITPIKPANPAKPPSPASPRNDEEGASDTSDAERVAIAVLGGGFKPSQKEKGLSRVQRIPRQEQTVVERGTQAFGNNYFDANKALKAKDDYSSFVKGVPEKPAEGNTKLKERVAQLERDNNAQSQFIQGFIHQPWYQGMMTHFQRGIAAQRAAAQVIKGLRAENEQLTKKLQTKEAENAGLKEKNGRLQAENEQLTKKLQTKEAENAGLKEKNGRLQAENEQLTKKLEGERKVNAGLKEKNGRLQAENEQLTKKVETTEEENAGLKEEIGRLQAEIDQLKEQQEAEDVIDLTEDGGER